MSLMRVIMLSMTMPLMRMVFFSMCMMLVSMIALLATTRSEQQCSTYASDCLYSSFHISIVGVIPILYLCAKIQHDSCNSVAKDENAREKVTRTATTSFEK